MDADGSGKLCLNEFQQVLDDYKIPGISASDTQRLFNVFDRNGDGEITFEEFLTALCGEMSDLRKRLVREAFEKLDENGNGTLELNEVKSKFDPTRHPDVKSGLKTVEEARFGFFEMFSTFHNASTGFSGDRSVSLEEFMEYHQYLNEQFERDVEFRNFLVGVWNMDLVPVEATDYCGKHSTVYGKNSREQWKYENHKVLFGSKDQQILSHEVKDQRGGGARGQKAQNDNFMATAGGKSTLDFAQNKGIDVKGEYNQKKQNLQSQTTASSKYISNEDLIKRVRDRLKARGARGIIGIGKSFKIMDDDNSKSLDSEEFAKALRDYRISSDKMEIEAIFDVFDPDDNGSINYDEFLRGVMGEMNKRREGIVRKAFKVIDTDKSGVLDINDIKGRYNAKKHPDVIAGKQTEEDILYEFLDTFEESYSIRNDPKARDRSVTIDEFIEYYQNISCSIDNDDYFELMLTNTWNLNNTPAPKKAWAGEL